MSVSTYIDRARAFFASDAAPGALLVFAALMALVFANSPLSSSYNEWLAIPVSVQFEDFSIAKPLLLWVNDGLMAVFFFLVGLEIKRELQEGNLRRFDQILLPAIAAVGGIAMPALVFVSINMDEPDLLRGWAIPSATDIAFALGVFSVFGRSLPLTLKLFLLSVAIFDDIGAIVIIALFYTSELSTLSLAVAGSGLAALFLLNRMRVSHQAAYFIVGMVVWAAVLKSGVHATLAGFAVAWFIPLKVNNAYGKPMLRQLEHDLHPWVTLLILPVFAFANAGVSLVGVSLETLTHPLTLGIALGLFVGKQLGVFGFSWVAIKLGIARMPEGANWMQLYAVSLLCGIGFTMSLFVGSLAFEGQGAAYNDAVKLGVLMGSLVSAVLGSWLIVRMGASDRSPAAPELGQPARAV